MPAPHERPRRCGGEVGAARAVTLRVDDAKPFVAQVFKDHLGAARGGRDVLPHLLGDREERPEVWKRAARGGGEAEPFVPWPSQGAVRDRPELHAATSGFVAKAARAATQRLGLEAPSFPSCSQGSRSGSPIMTCGRGETAGERTSCDGVCTSFPRDPPPHEYNAELGQTLIRGWRAPSQSSWDGWPAVRRARPGDDAVARETLRARRDRQAQKHPAAEASTATAGSVAPLPWFGSCSRTRSSGVIPRS